MDGKIDGLVVKIAERCNLNCAYCYMYNHADQSYLTRPRFISRDVFDSLLSRIGQYLANHPGHRMSMVFHGGEPMLMTPKRFGRLASAVRDRLQDRVTMGLQTNATLVTEEWIEVLKQHGIGVGVSIDGPPETHDRVRVDHRGRGSHHKVVEGIRRLQAGKVFAGSLTVVDPGCSGLDIYRHLRELGVKDMDFLLPEVSHDSRPVFYPGLGETPVADYLIPIFDHWFEEDDPEIKIRFFINVIRKLLGGESWHDSIGNNSTNYLIIDTDGSIQINDAFKVCAEGVCESGLNVTRNGFDQLHLGPPLIHRIIHEGIPLAEKCQACPEREICCGGSIPTRYSAKREFDNPSTWCQDLLRLIVHIRDKIRHEAAA